MSYYVQSIMTFPFWSKTVRLVAEYIGSTIGVNRLTSVACTTLSIAEAIPKYRTSTFGFGMGTLLLLLG